MPFDPMVLLAALPAVLLVGIGKGGFGGAIGFAATPMLALVIPPAQALGLMLPLLMLMDVAALRAFWRRWEWLDLRQIMAGMALGVALGWALFGFLSPAGMRLGIGALALGFVGWRISTRLGARPPASTAPAPRRAVICGAVSGVASFVAHAGGPPVAVHLLPRGFDKTTLQGTMVAAFAFVNLIKLPPYVGLGLIGTDTLLLSAILAPAAYGGIRFGVWLHGRVRQAAFERIVELGLVLAGLKLVHDGWAGLGG